MKVAVIGCTHAGTAFVTNAKRLYGDSVEITVFERNDTVSFLSCGIALHVGGVVKDPMKLFYSSPEQLMALGADVKMRHEVTHVDVENKKLTVRDLQTGNVFEERFDKMLVSTGSWPILPKVPGVELDGIKLSKNFYHAKEIVEAAQSARNIVVVGAGYIGVELAEAFSHGGKNVVLVDMADRILSRYLDEEFTKVLEDELRSHGIHVQTAEKVVAFEGANGKVRRVVTDKGEYDAELVIVAIGFKPNTELFVGKLETLPNGALIVDRYLRTSHPDIFAAGDCAAVWFTPTNSYEYIPLATNAVRMGTIAAYNLFANRLRYDGTQGTSGVKVFSYNVAATGITFSWAAEKGIKAGSVFTVENNRPEFMPEYEAVFIKLIYSLDDGRLLGGQVMSKADVTESANTLSLAIKNKMTLEELAFADFFFQPYFNKPWNFLNAAALKGLKSEYGSEHVRKAE